MGRLLELLIVAIIFYLAYRRMMAPLRRGFNERERERREQSMFRGSNTKQPTQQIDRSHVEDADFKDIT